MAGLGSGSSGAAQPDQAEALDPSQQWAIDMVYVDPDEPLPQDAEAVRKFLRQELPKKLPVFQRRLDCLIRDPYAGLLASQYLAVGPPEGFLPALLDVVGQLAAPAWPAWLWRIVGQQVSSCDLVAMDLLVHLCVTLAFGCVL